MKRLGKFEIQAIGFKKGEGSDSSIPLSSVISRHKHYSQAHHHLINNLGAEKSGIGPKAAFIKGNLRFQIVPVFPDKDKKKKPGKKLMKEVARSGVNSVRIIKEAVKRARNRILEDADKPQPDNKDDEDQDIVVKGNKTLTGEKADRINVNPEIKPGVIPKGVKANLTP